MAAAAAAELQPSLAAVEDNLGSALPNQQVVVAAELR